MDSTAPGWHGQLPKGIDPGSIPGYRGNSSTSATLRHEITHYLIPHHRRLENV